METNEIKEKLEKAKAERDKQQEKVDKLTDNMNQLRVRLTKENAKLSELNNKVDQQEFCILKNRLMQYGISGEDGIEDLLLIYEQYGHPKTESPNRADDGTEE